MLDNPMIEVHLNCDFFAFKKEHDVHNEFEAIIYTGPIDVYFKDHGLAGLEYRSINFKIERYKNMGYYQTNSVVNYPGPEVNNLKKTMKFPNLWGSIYSNCGV